MRAARGGCGDLHAGQSRRRRFRQRRGRRHGHLWGQSGIAAQPVPVCGDGHQQRSYVQNGTLVLPQAASGANYAFSAEYGSSSEGMLQLSGDGTMLAIAGYGIDAATFNANPGAYGSNDPDQARRAGAIHQPDVFDVHAGAARGGVDRPERLGRYHHRALQRVRHQQSPRGLHAERSAIYVSGQGSGSDATGGVFLANRVQARRPRSPETTRAARRSRRTPATSRS